MLEFYKPLDGHLCTNLGYEIKTLKFTVVVLLSFFQVEQVTKYANQHVCKNLSLGKQLIVCTSL